MGRLGRGSRNCALRKRALRVWAGRGRRWNSEGATTSFAAWPPTSQPNNGTYWGSRNVALEDMVRAICHDRDKLLQCDESTGLEAEPRFHYERKSGQWLKAPSVHKCLALQNIARTKNTYEFMRTLTCAKRLHNKSAPYRRVTCTTTWGCKPSRIPWTI